MLHGHSGREADSSPTAHDPAPPLSNAAAADSGEQQPLLPQPAGRDESTAPAAANAFATTASDADFASSTQADASASSAVGPSPAPVAAVPSSSSESVSVSVSAIESSLVILASSYTATTQHDAPDSPQVRFQPRPLPKPGSAAAHSRPLLTRAGSVPGAVHPHHPRPDSLLSSASPQLLSSLHDFSYHHDDPSSAHTHTLSHSGLILSSPDPGCGGGMTHKHRKSDSGEIWAGSKAEKERQRQEAEVAHGAADTPPAPAAAVAAPASVAPAKLLPPSQLTHSDLTRPPENRHRRGISAELRVPMDPHQRGSSSQAGGRHPTERAATKPSGATPPPDAARSALSPSFLLGTLPQHSRTPHPSLSQISADADQTGATVATTGTMSQKAMQLSRNAALAKAEAASAAVAANSGNPKDASSPRPDLAPLPLAPTRIRLRYLFFVFTLLQVVLCCGIVWWLGYRTSLETVRVLSSQIRQTQLNHVADDITRYASQVLVSADQVATSMALKLPELASVGGLDPAAAANVSVLHTPGLLGLLSYQLSSFNQIPMYGISSANGIFLSARHTSVPDRHTYQLQDPALSALRNASTVNTVYEFVFNRRAWYSNGSGHTDPFNDDSVRTHASYFQALPDFTGTQSREELLDMLGEPYQVLDRFNNSHQPFFQRAQQLDQATLGWSPAFVLQFEPVGKIAVAAIKPVMDTQGDPATGRLPSGNFSFVAFAAFYLDYLRESILDPLVSNLGAHGCVFVLESNGRLVASTRSGLDILDEDHPQVNLLLPSSDEFVSDMINTVRGSPLLGINRDTLDGPLLWAQDDWAAASMAVRTGGTAPDPDLPWPLPTAASRHTYSSSDRVSQSLLPGITLGDRAFRSSGADWHLSAKSLNIPGLDWVVIVCTRDSDFDGGLAANIITTIWFTVLVAVVAVAVSLLLAHCVSRPLSKLVAFMEIVAVKMQGRAAVGIKGGAVGAAHEAETNAELSEMCRQWKTTMESLRGSSSGSSRRRGASKASSGLASGSPNSDSDLSPSDADEDASGAIRMNRLVRRHSDSFMRPDDADRALENAADALAAGAPGGSGVKFRVPSRRTRPRKGLCARLKRHLPSWVRQFPMRETQLLQSSFGTMLQSLHKNHVQLQTANESKRRFIRYIFHESEIQRMKKFIQHTQDVCTRDEHIPSICSISLCAVSFPASLCARGVLW